MWSREEFERYNDRKVSFLERIGAATRALLHEVADDLEHRDSPHVACFVQLPYPVLLEPVSHSLKLTEPGVRAEVRADISSLQVTERGDARIVDGTAKEGTLEITQIVAFVPLWGRRRDFHGGYANAHAGDGSANPIVVPTEFSWLEGTPRPMRISEYDGALCRRMDREMRFLLGTLLPAYSVLSLCEAPVPSELSAFFVMSLPGHIRNNGLPQSILRSIGNHRTAKPREAVTAGALERALAIPLRTLSKFEHQLLAMNRLRSEGEPALALIGALSLAEWYANVRLGDEHARRQPSLSAILNDKRLLSFLEPAIKDTLLRSIQIRNRLVHGGPPRRRDISEASQTRSGSEDEGLAAVRSTIVEEVIHAVFEMYRQINMHLSQAWGAKLLRGESVETGGPNENPQENQDF